MTALWPGYPLDVGDEKSHGVEGEGDARMVEYWLKM